MVLYFFGWECSVVLITCGKWWCYRGGEYIQNKVRFDFALRLARSLPQLPSLVSHGMLNRWSKVPNIILRF